ncbi:hypothetical protein B0H65DRAFT_176446 [Neurospora tetraspora]|uniref:Uncharacterized protein n=1 Tax=Neurospora tetraspora TaxID=94610 RepID=A0AAE0JIC6_9PEZI|nr:hypothetical protein B0H65DRAFT_176446 [Neurospora tetraspora]
MVATTTTNAQPTMEASSLPAAPAAAVISEQPKSNPMLPTAQPQSQSPSQTLDVQDSEEQEVGVGLRGGWMTIGKHFNCCGLNCGFSKTF